MCKPKCVYRTYSHKIYSEDWRLFFTVTETPPLGRKEFAKLKQSETVVVNLIQHIRSGDLSLYHGKFTAVKFTKRWRVQTQLSMQLKLHWSLEVRDKLSASEKVSKYYSGPVSVLKYWKINHAELTCMFLGFNNLHSLWLPLLSLALASFRFDTDMNARCWDSTPGNLLGKISEIQFNNMVTMLTNV